MVCGSGQQGRREERRVNRQRALVTGTGGIQDTKIQVKPKMGIHRTVQVCENDERRERVRGERGGIARGTTWIR